MIFDLGLALFLGFLIGSFWEARHTRQSLTYALPCPCCHRTTLHALDCRYVKYPE